MKKITSAAAAAATAVALTLAMAGCATDTKPDSKSDSMSETKASGVTQTGAPKSGDLDVENTTLHQYIVDNNIAEAPFTADEPGTPKVDVPVPPDWRSAGDQTPEWAYGAIVYDKAMDPKDPPFIYAIASRLTGDVDPAKLIELAPGQLNGLPEFKAIGEVDRGKINGFDYVDYTGTYVWEGKTRAVGQQTIVIPGKDAIFVLQLNGEAPEGQEQPIIDAAKLINEQTTITLPS